MNTKLEGLIGVALVVGLFPNMIVSAQSTAIATECYGTARQSGTNATRETITVEVAPLSGSSVISQGDVSIDVYYNGAATGSGCAPQVVAGHASCDVRADLGPGNYVARLSYEDPSGKYGPSTGSVIYFPTQ